MSISHLVFDLDDTLYPPGNGLWHEIGERINRFLIERLAIDPAQVDQVRRQYYLTYGTTLRGLMNDYANLNPDDYLAFVHDVSLEHYLAANPALEAMLATLLQPKAIFTNSDAPHARRILNRLGVMHHFSTIVDIRAMQFENKPNQQAYTTLLNTLAAPAANCLLVEDSVRNLRPAKALGFTTLLVGAEVDPAVDYQVDSILAAGPVIQKILNA